MTRCFWGKSDRSNVSYKIEAWISAMLQNLPFAPHGGGLTVIGQGWAQCR